MKSKTIVFGSISKHHLCVVYLSDELGYNKLHENVKPPAFDNMYLHVLARKCHDKKSFEKRHSNKSNKRILKWIKNTSGF